MTEFGLALGFLAVLWGLDHPHLFAWPHGVPVAPPSDDESWLHSVKTNYADPIDDYRAGYIDRRTYVARLSALKRYITPLDFDVT